MTNSLSVAIGGLGAIGMAVARRLDDGVEGLHLAAVSARDREAAAFRMQNFRKPAPVVSAGELAAHGDIVVECAPAAVFAEIAEPALKAGRIFMPLSIGQLLEHPDYEDLARANGGRIIAPTGALLGLDAVRAAAEGAIESVTMVTRKPPGGLAGAPYLEQQGISVEGLSEPLKIFDGTAREAARGFPANVNVAAALSLAGIGPDRTRVEIWADPTVTRNTHVIKVEADSTRFEMKIEGVPSPENPRTGKLTPLSVIATLRGLVSPMRVGS
ncbi:MAG: aspartate dehydrogenase [Proteobacteria bacterium]|nr:aspartate dehydrogenase [Pseudomonadota bacterium]